MLLAFPTGVPSMPSNPAALTMSLAPSPPLLTDHTIFTYMPLSILLSCPQRYTKDPAATQDLPVPCRLRGTNHLLSETFLSSLPTGPRSLLIGSFQDEKKKEGGNYLILLQRKPLPNHSATKEEFTSTQTQISISLLSQTFSTPYTQF